MRTRKQQENGIERNYGTKGTRRVGELGIYLN